MREYDPPCPSGSDREAAFMQWVWRKIKQLEIHDSEDIKVKRDSRGVYLRSTVKGGGPGTSTPSGIKLYKVTQVGGALLWDYFKAKEVLPTGLLGDEQIIAKQHEQRPSIPSAVIETVQYDFVYSDDNNRVVTIHGVSPPDNSETEVCLPRYVTGTGDPNMALIWAAEVPMTGVTVSGTPVTLVDMTDREWQRVAGQ